MKIEKVTVVAALALFSAGAAFSQSKMDLSGKWNVNLGSDTTVYSINLPGTTDEAGLGTPVPVGRETTNLSRRHKFSGTAVYRRDIVVPANLKGRELELFIERARPSEVWLDGKRVGSVSHLSMPHVYRVGKLRPGAHTVEIRINNADSIMREVRENSHECTESTQTLWNGMLGEISLRPKTERLKITPVLSDSSFVVETGYKGKVVLRDPEGRIVDSRTVRDGKAVLKAGKNARLWSEWTPALYTVEIGEEKRKAGLREFKAGKDGRFYVNGHPVFLRGRHDACVFPLTAHVPTDRAEWDRYFSIIKEYGLNHVRFHSWCPPEACFAAADSAGVYLQPELPVWGSVDSKNTELTGWLTEEGRRIMDAYADHPSFVMFALGNELRGEASEMGRIVSDLRVHDNRPLYAFGSNIFLGWEGYHEGEDFMVACRVGGSERYESHVRASFSFADADDGGIMNHERPSTSGTFGEGVRRSPVPVVGHETGQYQFYPKYSELDKYKGVLRPDNLAEFRRRLEATGRGDRAGEYFDAAGKWAVQLYRDDIEMNLRTPGMAGFQLLDIQDYPGQGTALVGILDAFMDSKGLVEPAAWRRFCAPVTVLSDFGDYVREGDKKVQVRPMLANFSGAKLPFDHIVVSLKNTDNDILLTRSAKVVADEGLVYADSIIIPLENVNDTKKYIISLRAGDNVINEYPLWVFPAVKPDPEAHGVCHVTDPEAALAALREGKKVLLTPDSAASADVSVGPLYQTDYWNYRMFRTISEKNGRPVSPGTMGLLVNGKHPVFKGFPTDDHSDRQWFGIVKNSRPLILDALSPAFRPVVEVVDNVERNHHLGLLFEAKVGEGRLMVAAVDYDAVASTPEGAAWIESILNYMESDFADDTILTENDILSIFKSPIKQSDIRDLHNISY